MKYVHGAPFAARFAVIIQCGLTALAFATQTDGLPTPGRISLDQVRAIIAQWKSGTASDESCSGCIQNLKRVRQGATVKVFWGAWCDNSRYQIPQFVRLIDTLGDESPFAVEFFAVDEQKQRPPEEVRAYEIEHLPTFIVLRHGHEVGRVVDQPARTLEVDLLRLLDGSARGLLSSNETAIIRYLTPPVPGNRRRQTRNKR
jgi:thiol-disulfide isomerase/thioredoxin